MGYLNLAELGIQFPKMTFSSVISQTSTTQDVINGEILIGQTSGAIAVSVGTPDNLSVSFITKSN